MNKILDLLKVTCFLKKLSIPKTKLNEYSVDAIETLISAEHTYHLIDLDISWNQLSSHSMGRIIKSLDNNERLRFLNLSWNEIREDTNLKPLGKFLRNNQALVHLDISKMFSTAKQIKYIIKCIKKSRSLQSVHLNNTAIIRKRKAVYKYIVKKLDALEKRQDPARIKKPNIHELFKYNWKE